MMAATARPLTRGRFHGRDGLGSPTAAHAAPNKGSAAGIRDALSCLANWQNDSGRDPNLSSDPRWVLPFMGRWHEAPGPSEALFTRLGLGALGHRPLQRGPAACMQGVHLLP